MRKNVVNVGLIGLGTVGTGVYKLFKNSAEIINNKSGCNVNLLKVCDIKKERFKKLNIKKEIATTDVNHIINNPEIDIVIELIGGLKPAYDFILTSLKNKKHVVTANKALLSVYWENLIKTADENNVWLMVEASVGGGIPVIRALMEGLAANKIQKIIGILNGTTNFILTKMFFENKNFSDALKEAQKMGFAEADPTLDIEGFDAMHKIIVLSNIAFSKFIKEKDVYVEGIKNVDSLDITFGYELGYIMKLLAIAEKEGDSLNVRVHPTFVAKDKLIASVNYENNAIFIKGDAVGETMFYGKGAGQMPTASAILSDVIEIAKNLSSGVEKIPYLIKETNLKILKIGDVKSKYYIRFNVVDKPGVLAKISGVLGKHDISIQSVIQKARSTNEKVPVVFMTYEAKEENFKKAIKEIDNLSIIKEKTVFYRVMD
jgi:homoserine dehydrogenase